MPLTPQAQALVTEFGHQPGVTADQVTNLQSVIDNSPALVAQINSAVTAGHLQHIVPLTNPNAGGEYDGQGKNMRLPLSILTSPPAGGAPFNGAEPTFVLGHELQHGFNHAATTQAYTDFRTQAGQVAQSPGPVHDYTAATAALIGANRRDEAGAEVAGFNAIVGMVKHTKPNPTLGDLYEASPFRMGDFIDRGGASPNYTYTLKPNLTLNADQTLTATPHNIEGMGQNYFDKPPRSPGGLGHNGNSDYANYYGAYAVGVAAQYERHYNPPQPGVTPPQMAINLSQMHLTESLMEQNGVNLGTNTHPMPYLDTSTAPPTAHQFNHTTTTHAHVPIAAAEDAQRTLPPLTQRTQADPHQGEPRQGEPRGLPPGHPDHALYQQIRDGVERIDSRQGKPYDEASERLTRSAVAAVKENGGGPVNHVMLSDDGSKLFLVKGPLNDPSHQRTTLSVAEAAQTPVVDSQRRADAATPPAQETPQPNRQEAPRPTLH
ncbi:MAG: XVIPCD domain-containing protein [Lysobacter sp.]